MTQQGDNPTAGHRFNDDDMRLLSACCWDYLIMADKAVEKKAAGPAQTFMRRAEGQLEIQLKALGTTNGTVEDTDSHQQSARTVKEQLSLAENAVDEEEWQIASRHIKAATMAVEASLGKTPAITAARAPTSAKKP